MNKPNAAIIIGSDSVRNIMKPAVDMLDKFGVSYKDQRRNGPQQETAA